MKRSQVLIVGAGPTGLTLACDLARRGVQVRVIEKAAELFVGSRAKGLQPRTLEVFDDLGVLDAVIAGGAPFPPFRLYAGTELLWERTLEEMLRRPPAPPSPAIPYPRAWLIPQFRTDAILAARFVALGGRLETATELVGLAPEEDGVVATLTHEGVRETLLAEYLVGADGGRSFVRRASGFAFEGETNTTEHTLIGDVRATGLSGDACHILTRAGDMTSRFSLWDLQRCDYFQFVATLAASETPELSLATVRDLLATRSGRSDVALDDLRWISNYRINVRMVDRLRLGRVLLAGDAAHVHSSAGGQGLNTGIQDAYNLGWKLAAALRDPRADRLLDTYDAERLPVAAHVLGLTSRLHRGGFAVSPGSPPPAIDQLDIGYRSSPLAFDDGTVVGTLQAGDRAPDARLADGTRAFDAFRGPQFTLLAFGGCPTPAPRDGLRVVALEHAIEGYGVERGLVLVRPDGHVAAMTSSPKAITDYLEGCGAG